MTAPALRVIASTLKNANDLEYEQLSEFCNYGINLHPIWLRAFVEELDFPVDVMLEVRDSSTGKLCGLLPMVRKDERESRLLTRKRLVPAGMGPTDFFDIPARPGMEPAVSAALAKWFVDNRPEWDELLLKHVPRTNRTWSLFVAQLELQGQRVTALTDEHYLKIDTSGPYSEYLQSLGSDKQSYLRNRWRRLQKLGETDVQHLSSGTLAHFDEFIAIYRTRRQVMAQSDPYSRRPKQYAFMKRVLASFEDRGWVRLSIIRLNARPVAYCYQLRHNGVVYYFLPAFVQELEHCSPGKLMVSELLQQAFADPEIREFNFMRSEYPYKLWFYPDREAFVTVSMRNSRSYRNAMVPIVRGIGKVRRWARSSQSH